MDDVYNKLIWRPTLLDEATSLGAAIAGGVGVGIFKDFSFAEELTPIVETLYTDPDVQLKYQALYALFNELYEALVPMFTKLADL